MSTANKISNALISVFYKDGLAPIAKELHQQGVKIYSTGGTQEFIEKMGIPVIPVEQLTGYPSILGGRVKTLHPKVFGGILARREEAQDLAEIKEFDIPLFDLVMVDLYPFEETLAQTNEEQKIIEKIDIGGVSLIRAAAKNFKHSLIVSHTNQYSDLLEILVNNNGESRLSERKSFAAKAFQVTSHYDTAIFNWFNKGQNISALKVSYNQGNTLRYGENPHQRGFYFGQINDILEQLHGKELSYNNLLDVDAAVNLLNDFEETTVAIIKHNNPCGVASRDTVLQAWTDALAGDPVSAFGGIIALNRNVDLATATEMDKIFLEVLVAPSYDEDALALLKGKKNRIILKQTGKLPISQTMRSVLNGVLVQDRDLVVLKSSDLKSVTSHAATASQIEDLLFADKIVKHTKSNTIVLAKNKQLLGIGCGQTSRVDALKHAISKAHAFGFELKEVALSSDAFFPFPDCVEIAHKEGINAVIQPGGSIKDDASITYCEQNGVAMYFSGVRHFKH
ncbi:MAG: bifunctional phosphoribosylaminoimidazolecarboxamide formyltransferase/IMP cyclohydrolase [Bacteroidia bacterium]|nr:bifunctional phosphoribosylaminoimidazolecarboxamide formyltransferase/IMP cyclohydrolase [Bacteroidia bacterium]MCF8425913.1 bifunctional phosphoribosylaminoimidazolecarboxamide formyltransferase/IMP cyclohydrolase [Bacteroidia bacterium]MCF8446146.1 bifunctional phosphoribosylaminoimidazolecarboxamide formyltransferase/IMP cyclohydrolase [Bacteroidia bacterium]